MVISKARASNANGAALQVSNAVSDDCIPYNFADNDNSQPAPNSRDDDTMRDDVAISPRDGAAPDEMERLIDGLAELSALAYEQRRYEAAKKLGVRVSVLDNEVERRRAGQSEATLRTELFEHWKVMPWPEPIDGAELLFA